MSERKIANNHYPGLDVVRVIAIAGIVLMHVLANGNYDLSGFLFEKVKLSERRAILPFCL